MKDLNPKAYTPKLVSIGPYYHDMPHLLAMDEHKARSLQRFLHRTKMNYNSYFSALSHSTEALRDSYQQLVEAWKEEREGGRDRFLRLMVVDGSFLYEVMLGASKGWDGYDEHDPIFRKDQLSQQEPFPNMTPGHGLHLLDVSRKVAAKGFLPTSDTDHEPPAIAVKSARKLLSAGVKFNVIKDDDMRDTSFDDRRDISFDGRTLSLPLLKFDSMTEPYFLNAIAFECLHPKARREVSSYVAFMKGLISSPEDFTALDSLGVIESVIGDSHAVVSLVKEMSKNVFFDPSSNLCKVRDSINEYHRIKMKKWQRRSREWWRSLRENHLKNPWTIIAIVAAFIILVLTLIQTIYTVLSHYHG